MFQKLTFSCGLCRAMAYTVTQDPIRICATFCATIYFAPGRAKRFKCPTSPTQKTAKASTNNHEKQTAQAAMSIRQHQSSSGGCASNLAEQGTVSINQQTAGSLLSLESC